MQPPSLRQICNTIIRQMDSTIRQIFRGDSCTARDFSDKLMLTLTTSLGSSARGGKKASTYFPPHKRGGDSHKKSAGVCHAFKEGNCVRGPQCKFRHG